MTLKLHPAAQGLVVEHDGRRFQLPNVGWDAIFAQDDLCDWLLRQLGSLKPAADAATSDTIPAPIESQEVWAAGVTYFRSRSARMEESDQGGDFYDKVYSAARPELFFKASAHRVVGNGGQVRIRGDAQWNVPEPELTLCVSPSGRIIGYTIGNDMSSRDIEGENPLYLPQAKVYDGCCALGPSLLVSGQRLADETEIAMQILRGGSTVFSGATKLARMKRSPEELIEYLFRHNSFPAGCFLLTGTGVVPPNEFTLASGDEIRITIAPIGTLVNRVG